MIEITIDPTSKDRIKKVLARLDSKNEDNVIKRGVMAASIFVLNVLLLNVSGIILRIRTGNLARSMGMRVEKQSGAWVGVVGSGALLIDPKLSQGGGDVSVDKTFRMVYANILETGGTITPTGGRKYLTMPLKAAMTPAGVARFTAPQVRDGATEYEGSVIIFPYIYGKKGKKLIPLFKLLSSVFVPPKRYLSETAESSNSRVGEIMANEIEKGLKE